MAYLYYMSRQEAKSFNPHVVTCPSGDNVLQDKSWVMLSISEPGQTPPAFEYAPFFEKIITVQFKDVTTGIEAPTIEQAALIHHYLDTWSRQAVNIAVHCFAGVSRSGAVAKYVDSFNGPESQRMAKYTHANSALLRYLQQQHPLQPAEPYQCLSYPFDVVRPKVKCWDCDGDGCADCIDGYRTPRIFLPS